LIAHRSSDICPFTSHGVICGWFYFTKERNEFYVGTSPSHNWKFICPCKQIRAFIEQSYTNNNYRKP